MKPSTKAAILACIFILAAAAILVVRGHIFPDPGQQVRQGIEAAREACRDGRRLTEREDRICQYLQQ